MITVEEAIAAQRGSSGFLLQYRDELAENDHISFPGGVNDVTQLAFCIASASLYTWSKHIKRVVDESCAAYPLDEAIRSLHYFHQPLMLWLFDDPVLWIEPPAHARTNNPSAVDAILIAPHALGEPRTPQDMLRQITASPEERARIANALQDSVTGIVINAFSSLRTGKPVALPIGSLVAGSRLCVPVMSTVLMLGQSATVSQADIIEEQQTDQTIVAEQTRLRKWVLAAAALIKQRILVSQQQLATRCERKRLDRLALPTSVMTIALRSTEHAASGTTQGEVEWSHRWIVRGHWRQQWYPSQEEHRVLWIPPYIKGPDDQPLVVRPAVYAVTR